MSVRVFPNTRQSVSARGHDISCGGMSFFAPVELEVGATIKLAFQLPDSRVPFEVAAVVKNRNKQDFEFRYGVEFVGLAPEERATIEKLDKATSWRQVM